MVDGLDSRTIPRPCLDGGNSAERHERRAAICRRALVGESDQGIRPRRLDGGSLEAKTARARRAPVPLVNEDLYKTCLEAYGWREGR